MAPDVRFERNAQPVSDETSLEQLGLWAEAGDRVEVLLCGERVSLAFEAAYTQEGKKAAARSIEGRAFKAAMAEVSTLWYGGLVLIGLAVVVAIPIIAVRRYLGWRLASLQEELRQQVLRQQELEVAGWSSRPALSDEECWQKFRQCEKIKRKLRQ